MAETSRVNFFGAIMRLRADDAAWQQKWNRALPDFVEGAGGPHNAVGSQENVHNVIFDVHFTHCERLPDFDDNLPLVWSGAYFEGGTGHLRELGPRSDMMVDGECLIQVDREKRRAVASILPDQFRSIMGSPSMFLVQAVLEAANQHLIHAACVEHNGGGVLLFAPSGSGKTTTSLALARQGLGIQTDDASSIMTIDGVPHVWGLPRPFKVHKKSADLMPWIKSAMGEKFDANGEQGVFRDRIKDLIAIAKPRPVPLKAIIWIGPRREFDHRFTPMSKAKALIGIIGDNTGVMPNQGVPARGQGMIAAVSD
jgi:hypothetical protein